MLVVCSTAAAPADAATLTFGSDAEFIAFQGAGGFSKVWGAQSRWGDVNPGNPGNTFEVAIVDADSTPIGNGGQEFEWSSVPPGNHLYSLTYASGGAISYTVSGATVAPTTATATATAPAGYVNALAVRGRIGPGDIVDLQDVVIQFASDLSFFNLGALLGDGDAEYRMLIDERLAGGFWINGVANLRDGSQALPMYEFKVGYSPTPVPLPAAGWLLLSSLGMVGVLARRRK